MIAFRPKMATPEAQKQYRRRSRAIEFCHAWIKSKWIKSKLGLRQFHLRGLARAQMEVRSGTVSPTTCNRGSNCANCKPQPLNPAAAIEKTRNS